VAIFFATGAVSGTALSFELGVLWPGFMAHAGPIIGMPFSLEGAAFFVEAIALGIYFYGWGRIPPRVHFWSGVVVGVAGVASGALVIAANGWMNSPTGFRWDGVMAHDIDPWAAMFNAAWPTQSTHMILAAFEAVGLAAAGVHAFALRPGQEHNRPMHELGLRIALAVGAVAAILQPFHGHLTAQSVAVRQPEKLAAMEALFETGPRAPLLIGGIPDLDTKEVAYGIEVPGLLSFIAFDDFDAEVQGLEDFDRDTWPPVVIVHFAFQTMVGIGSLLAAFGAIALVALVFRRHWLDHRLMRRAIILCAPLGFVAIEAGWIVTEVGRQPWIIYGIMRTADAVTPVPGQIIHLAVFVTLYALIGASTVWMWRRQVRYARTLPDPSESLTAWAQKQR
jgi:cytochrome d ubiquinol oxidase subunit I